MLRSLRARAEKRAVTDQLYDAISDQSRNTLFFNALDVADTFDGRFDMIVLHAWLVLDELAQRGNMDAARRLIDTLFIHFDEALRDLGAGDVGMSRRMKKMASAFFGRLEAYRSAQDTESLAEAIVRNVYRGDASRLEAARRIATYCVVARENLVRLPIESGEVDFGSPAATAN